MKKVAKEQEKARVKELEKRMNTPGGMSAASLKTDSATTAATIKTFMPKMTPSVTRKLGVGLAAAVHKKLSESREKFQAELSEDSAYYDDESDTSEKRNQFKDPNALAEDSYYDEEDDLEGHIGKGYDSDSAVDLTEFTE